MLYTKVEILPCYSDLKPRYAELLPPRFRDRSPNMDTTTPPVVRVNLDDWLFWLSWVAASTAAILIGVGIIYGSIFLAKAVVPGINEDRFMGVLIFPVLATLLGVLQWLVLRRRIPRSAWWILATVAGMLGGIALGSGFIKAILHFTGRQWNWDSTFGVLVFYWFIGYFLALAQLPILWRRIKFFAFWPLAGMLGWLALGLIIGKSIDRISDILALGTVPAAFTGLCLIWPIRTRLSPPIRPA